MSHFRKEKYWCLMMKCILCMVPNGKIVSVQDADDYYRIQGDYVLEAPKF